jgi:hypothetical protein
MIWEGGAIDHVYPIERLPPSRSLTLLNTGSAARYYHTIIY